MRRVALITHPVFGEHDPGPGHPERPERYFAAVKALTESGLSSRMIAVEARRATRAELERVHSGEYIDAFDRIAARGSGSLDIETHVSPRTGEAAYMAAGAVCAAVDLAVEGKIDAAFALVRPPGHHAERSRGMGFCFFNNVAVGAAHALARGRERVAILDFDAHHGNGIQFTFQEDASVFYGSMHCWPDYPGTGGPGDEGAGDGTTVNRPLSPGSGDRVALSAWDEICGAAGLFKPEMVFLSAGFDAHEDDPLMRLRLTPGCFAEITRRVLGVSGGVPIISALEGGYDIAALGESLVEHVRVLVEGR